MTIFRINPGLQTLTNIKEFWKTDSSIKRINPLHSIVNGQARPFAT